MRKLISFVIALYMCLYAIPALAAPIQICYDGATHLYTGNVYRLFVNGSEIKAAMEPIIFNGHALVPVREVFEACGAEVEYLGDTRCVKVNYNKTQIKMNINDNRAYVNGKAVRIPDGVVPKLIYKPGGLTKTMVPVRFISESVGMNVGFDGDKGEITISEPDNAVKPVATQKPTAKPTEKPVATLKPVPVEKPENETVTIKDIETDLITEKKVKLVITADKSVKGLVSYFDLKSPERVVVDFKGVKYKNVSETIKLGSEVIPTARVGVDSERTRIVIDVTDLIDYDVDIDGNIVTITARVSGDKSNASKPTATPTPTKKPNYTEIGNSAANSKYNTGIVQASKSDAKKIIMLDAGHGGSDPGALGELNDKTIKEKDLTLSITYKVKAILEKNGYRVALTRKGDTLPSLSERPEMANDIGAALFISIHINSATSEDAHGTEVYYSDENNEDDYGVTSQELATKVLDGMLKYMKSYDRGVRMANWAVTRRSEMPAILLEVGFISNESELRKMCNDDYQNKTAMGIAEGIINTIHYVDVP